MSELPAQSRLGALLHDLEQFTGKLRAHSSKIEPEPRSIVGEVKQQEPAPAPDHDLQYRLEQWHKDELVRAISTSVDLYAAIVEWKDAVRKSPRSSWLLRYGAQVLMRHEPGATDGEGRGTE